MTRQHTAIMPDRKWPGMYRVREPSGRLTDMVNLARAKDAAKAGPSLKGSKTGLEGVWVRQNRGGV